MSVKPTHRLEPCADRENGRLLPAIRSGPDDGVSFVARYGVDQRTVYWYESADDATAALDRLAVEVERRPSLGTSTLHDLAGIA